MTAKRQRSWNPSSGKPKPLWVWKQEAKALLEFFRMLEKDPEFCMCGDPHCECRQDLNKVCGYLDKLTPQEIDEFMLELAIETRSREAGTNNRKESES